MLADTKVSTPLTLLQKEVGQVLKDTYVLEFLDLPTNYSARRSIWGF
jgi:predicted nuclease of restriction endonuclease-like (RecB) superfamily